MIHSIGYTRNGIELYVDLIRSRAARHIARRPQLLGYIEEVVQKTDCSGPAMIIEHDLGRPIGYSFVVPTGDADNIFYAQVLHDKTYTRFVKNGKPLSTQYLTVQLQRSEDGGAYELQDAWLGRHNPPRPGSPNETTESRLYWASHAFVHDSQSLQLRTITKECPY